MRTLQKQRRKNRAGFLQTDIFGGYQERWKKFLYRGSFDPLANGHLDIIKRASKLCDTLVVGIVTNSSEKPLFTSGGTENAHQTGDGEY